LSYTPSGDPFAATRAAMQERRICVIRIRARQAPDSAEVGKTRNPPPDQPGAASALTRQRGVGARSRRAIRFCAMMSSRRIFAENPPIPQNSRSFSRLREFRHTIEPRTRTSDRRRLSLGCRGHGSPARIDFAVEGVIAFGRTAPVEIERHRGSAHLLELLRRLIEFESLRYYRANRSVS